MSLFVVKMQRSFPKSYFNANNEFIAHERSNAYFGLNGCRTDTDIKCKIIEWLSYYASKGQPYDQDWRNKKFRKFMLDGINNTLDTNFSIGDIDLIYQKLGNRINHDLTVKFVESGFDMKVLEGWCK